MRKARDIVLEIMYILGKYDIDIWKKQFFKICQCCDSTDLEDISYCYERIASLFGGMGSFTDLVLYDKNHDYINDNNLLESLKIELHNNYVNYRTSNIAAL